MPLAKWLCVASVLFLWFAQNQSGTPVSKPESEQEQQQANSQPAITPPQTPQVQTDVKPPEAKPAESERQAQQENPTSAADKPLTRAETFTLILGLLTFAVLAFQTYIYKRLCLTEPFCPAEQ